MASKQTYPWATYSRPKISPHKPGVLVSSLTQSQQRVLWEGIKTLAPEMAQLITTDAGFAELKTAFQADLFIELPDFNRYIEAGQKIIEERRNAQTVQLAGSPPSA
jgi:phage tail protein X